MTEEVKEEKKQEAKVYQGSVVFYNQGRGFGFIKREGMADIFFHHTGLLDKNTFPQQNDTVSFEITEGREGKEKAVEVQKIEGDQLDLPLEEEE